MKDINTEEKKKSAPAVTVEIQDGLFARIGTVSWPVALYSKPERTVKSKGGGGTKTIKAKMYFRAVVPDIESAVRGFHQALVTAGENGKALAEKILGPWLTEASESGIVTDRAGNTQWNEDVYAKALVELHAKRAGTSITDLQKESTAILAALVNTFEAINKWTDKKNAALASGTITEDADGNLSGDPFTAQDWSDVSVALERETTDIDALLEYQMNLKARRLEVERQLAEKSAAQEKAKQTREANKAKKSTPAAPAPATVEPAENLEPVAH